MFESINSHMKKGPIIRENPKKWKKAQTFNTQRIKTGSPSYDVESLTNANFGKRGNHPLKIFIFPPIGVTNR